MKVAAQVELPIQPTYFLFPSFACATISATSGVDQVLAPTSRRAAGLYREVLFGEFGLQEAS